MTKTLSKLKIEEIFLHLVKTINKRASAKIILSDEKPKAFPLILVTRHFISTFQSQLMEKGKQGNYHRTHDIECKVNSFSGVMQLESYAQKFFLINLKANIDIQRNGNLSMKQLNVKPVIKLLVNYIKLKGSEYSFVSISSSTIRHIICKQNHTGLSQRTISELYQVRLIT